MTGETGFLDELKEDGSYLGVTFYVAVGIVATLVIIIVLLMIGYCCLARFIIRRNR